MISRFAKLARHEKRATQRVRCSFRHLIWKSGYKCFKLSLKVRWWRRYCTSSLWSWQTNRSSGRAPLATRPAPLYFSSTKVSEGMRRGRAVMVGSKRSWGRRVSRTVCRARQGVLLFWLR